MTKRYILIGRSTCPFCTMAEDFLEANQVQTVFLDYSDRPSILEDYKDFHNHSTVPIIHENDLSTGLVKFIGRYSDLLEALK